MATEPCNTGPCSLLAINQRANQQSGAGNQYVLWSYYLPVQAQYGLDRGKEVYGWLHWVSISWHGFVYETKYLHHITKMMRKGNDEVDVKVFFFFFFFIKLYSFTINDLPYKYN